MHVSAAKAPLDIAHHDAVQQAEVQRQAEARGCAPEEVPRGALSYPEARNGKGGSTSQRKSDGGECARIMKHMSVLVCTTLPQRWQQLRVVGDYWTCVPAHGGLHMHVLLCVHV